MTTKTEQLSLDHPEAFNRAAEVIQAGGVIAFPTDTVYGIGVSAFNKDAIEKIYQVKERSQLKAIPILVGDVSDLDQITPPFSAASQANYRQLLARGIDPGTPVIP